LAEHRLAANELNFWSGDEACRNRISYLVLNQVRRSSLPIRVNDDLDVAKIRNCVKRRLLERVNSASQREEHKDKHKEVVPSTPGDKILNHCCACGWSGSSKLFSA